MSMICGALAWLRANEARQPPVAKVRGAGSAVVSALDASIRAMGGSPSAAAAAAAAAEMEIEARNDEPAWVTEHVVKVHSQSLSIPTLCVDTCPNTPTPPLPLSTTIASLMRAGIGRGG
jgi:hypothetical protein